MWRSRLLSQAANNWLSDKTADTSSYDKQEQTSLLKLFSVCTSVLTVCTVLTGLLYLLYNFIISILIYNMMTIGVALGLNR